jgi:glycosyltransferase involved in cell wall biosynthesis
MQSIEKNLKSLKISDVTSLFSNRKTFDHSEAIKSYISNLAPKAKIKPDGFLLRRANISQPKVTVIVPCYNTGKYIFQCIDSILSQTLESIEIILVDDSSTDDTLHNLMSYAYEDNRINLVVLSKQSGSPGKARNIGMTLARAPYIYFLDSDDWLEDNTLENLSKVADANQSEICFLSGFINHLEEKCTKRYYKKPISDPQSHLIGFHESFMLWDKLWSAAFLKKNKLKVAHTSASEELLFILKAYYFAKRISVSTGNYGYNYRRLNESSITKNIRSVAYPSFEFEAWKLVDDWVSNTSISKEYLKIVALRKVLSFNYALSIVNDQHREKFMVEISEYMKGILDDEVLKIAKELNYSEQVEKFSSIIPSSSSKEKIASHSPAKNVLFGPDWSSSNPYQALLYKAIKETHGNYATGFSPAQLTKEYLDSKSKTSRILHLHWLHPFYDASNIKTVHLFIETLAHARKLGYTLVWTAHNLMPHDITPEVEPAHLMVRQAVLDMFDTIITHDKKTLSALAEKFSVDINKCHIAPHGLYKRTLPDKPAVRSAVRQHLGIDRERFTVLLAGRIRGYKGIERALNIFLNGRKFLTQSCTLIVAGHPDDKEIDAQIQAAAISDSQIKYVRGNISDEELEALFIASDICLLPYEKSATSGLAFLSISYKTPLITSKLPAFESFVKEGMALWGSNEQEIENAIEYARNACQNKSLDLIFSALNDDNLQDLQWTSIVRLPAYSKTFK